MLIQESLYPSINENIALIQRIFPGDSTIKFRKFQHPSVKSFSGCLIHIEGMVSTETLSNYILRPILRFQITEETHEIPYMQLLMEGIIEVSELRLLDDLDGILNELLYGNTVLLLEGDAQALIVGTQGWQSRSVSEPGTEKSVLGPREGFTESLIINLSLIRRRVKSPDLKFEFLDIGKTTNTTVCLCYVEGAVSRKILQDLTQRLERLEIDALLDSGQLQEMIRDHTLTPFETVGNTERPDALAGKILEGRIALLVDGSPFVLTVPFLFVEYFQVSEDYYSNYLFGSFNRIMRFLGEYLAVPAIYVSLVTYNQEMMPTPLLLSISAARQSVPLPTVAECFVMLIVFEILREAGTRIPNSIGQAVSIVGALVLGQAAVDARVVSAPMVIVVGITGITTLLNVKMKAASITTRFILLVLSSFMGLYGYMFGMIGLVIHLMSLRSFGVPYMLTVGSFKESDIRDTVIRLPWWGVKVGAPLAQAKRRIRKVRR
ncbi:spore germination protein [Paenibacillus timonensis]|uniref:Spore germination protein n=1 Tax=Paenibacillus timonensis TaxID=225915 RepID=A0ABW3SBK8_9BACL|nr:spore germination protein [Paenibacillus timonensis]MCH1640195.1 spore germination protein [Paenibacillus timonensis]